MAFATNILMVSPEADFKDALGSLSEAIGISQHLSFCFLQGSHILPKN